MISTRDLLEKWLNKWESKLSDDNGKALVELVKIFLKK